MSENNKKLKSLLSKLFNISEESITDEISPQNSPSWDSFNGLLLVSELEELFDVHFTIEEMYAVKCVKDIKDALKRHSVDL